MDELRWPAPRLLGVVAVLGAGSVGVTRFVTMPLNEAIVRQPYAPSPLFQEQSSVYTQVAGAVVTEIRHVRVG